MNYGNGMAFKMQQKITVSRYNEDCKLSEEVTENRFIFSYNKTIKRLYRI